MKLKHFLAIASLFVLATALLAQEPKVRATDAKPVTVIVVRHAEKALDASGGADPALSEAGVERAQALARLLGKAGVTDVFCTEYQRTRATVAPLAEVCELDAQAVPAQEDERQVALLRALEPGAVAVVAGHSNTVPELVRALGGEVDEIDDIEYDRLFLVTLPGAGAAPQTLELRYGR